jgi:hypothetical protein
MLQSNPFAGVVTAMLTIVLAREKSIDPMSGGPLTSLAAAAPHL